VATLVAPSSKSGADIWVIMAIADIIMDGAGGEAIITVGGITTEFEKPEMGAASVGGS
jgi:hypothetical protein